MLIVGALISLTGHGTVGAGPGKLRATRNRLGLDPRRQQSNEAGAGRSDSRAAGPPAALKMGGKSPFIASYTVGVCHDVP